MSVNLNQPPSFLLHPETLQPLCAGRPAPGNRWPVAVDMTAEGRRFRVVAELFDDFVIVRGFSGRAKGRRWPAVAYFSADTGRWRDIRFSAQARAGKGSQDALRRSIAFTGRRLPTLRAQIDAIL